MIRSEQGHGCHASPAQLLALKLQTGVLKGAAQPVSFKLERVFAELHCVGKGKNFLCGGLKEIKKAAPLLWMSSSFIVCSAEPLTCSVAVFKKLIVFMEHH